MSRFSRWIKEVKGVNALIEEEHGVNPLSGFGDQNTGPVLSRTFIR